MNADTAQPRKVSNVTRPFGGVWARDYFSCRQRSQFTALGGARYGRATRGFPGKIAKAMTTAVHVRT